MSTATAETEAPAETVAPVTFLAKRPGHRLVMKPGHKALQNERGILAEAIPGVAVEFDPREGNSFTTTDPDLIGFLRGHRLFNVEIWEEGAPPDVPRPTVAEQMKAITAAAVAQDRDALSRVLTEETETHDRDEVKLAIKSALEAIDGD